MSTDKAYIYGLIDPTTLGIRYIGKSFSPRVRFLKHLSDDTGCQKDSWIMSLRMMGITPILTILELTTKAEVMRAEKRWIATGNRLGWELTNTVHSDLIEDAQVDSVLQVAYRLISESSVIAFDNYSCLVGFDFQNCQPWIDEHSTWDGEPLIESYPVYYAVWSVNPRMKGFDVIGLDEDDKTSLFGNQGIVADRAMDENGKYRTGLWETGDGRRFIYYANWKRGTVVFILQS